MVLTPGPDLMVLTPGPDLMGSSADSRSRPDGSDGSDSRSRPDGPIEIKNHQEPELKQGIEIRTGIVQIKTIPTLVLGSSPVTDLQTRSSELHR